MEKPDTDIMQQLNGEALNQYQSALKGGGSDRVMPHYVKWVRYFLDYMGKCGNGAVPVDLVEGFLSQLASKGQSAGLRDQARHAVGVYIGLGFSDPATQAEVGVPAKAVTSGQEGPGGTSWRVVNCELRFHLVTRSPCHLCSS